MIKLAQIYTKVKWPRYIETTGTWTFIGFKMINKIKMKRTLIQCTLLETMRKIK